MDPAQQFEERQRWWGIHCGAVVLMFVIGVFGGIVQDSAMGIPGGLDLAVLGYAGLRGNRTLIPTQRESCSYSLDGWADGVELDAFETFGLWLTIALGIALAGYATFDLVVRWIG